MSIIAKEEMLVNCLLTWQLAHCRVSSKRYGLTRYCVHFFPLTILLYLFFSLLCCLCYQYKYFVVFKWSRLIRTYRFWKFGCLFCCCCFGTSKSCIFIYCYFSRFIGTWSLKLLAEMILNEDWVLVCFGVVFLPYSNIRHQFSEICIHSF